jgi:2-oxoglutarate ferredoxin oxidoreductase subunit alpha
MQLVGNQFTYNTAHLGHDLATFPDFPAEIRAPQGTLAGVSGFQIHFGSVEIDTPGDVYDVLVVMNAAALKNNIKSTNSDTIIIADISGFDSKNLKLAGHLADDKPLDEIKEKVKVVYEIDITKLTSIALAESSIDAKDKDRCKNMFALGVVYWLYERDLDETIQYINEKFSKNSSLKDANILTLQKGFHFGETTEIFHNRFHVLKAKQQKGNYRGINGNEALGIALICAGAKSNLPLYFSTYPITPASDILHFLAKKEKEYHIKVFQAEDEISAISSAIGASFGGSLAVCSTSGPGMALKTEALGLAVSMELPLVVCNIQRAGPSTGMPTKTEQTDLLQAVYGRNGEAPLPVLAASSPSDCFYMTYEACRIAIEHMTPVILLSDLFLANGTEPWLYPKFEDLKPINNKKINSTQQEVFLPFSRDENLVRNWAIPGTKNLEHRIGGIEKQQDTGSVSYDGDNHQKMIQIRAEKVNKIAQFIPNQDVELGEKTGDIAIVGWGSTYGSIRTVTKELLNEDKSIAHIHIKYLHPFPSNLKELLSGYKKVLVAEINNGQLVKLIREQFLIDAIPFNQIKGQPIKVSDLKSEILKQLEEC